MDIWIFSDESGVFDYNVRKYFVYSGLIFLDKTSMDKAVVDYRFREKIFRKKKTYRQLPELKAFKLELKDRSSLFNMVSHYDRFAFIINMDALDKQRVFATKKSKQKYLDWVYKSGLRKLFSILMERGSLLLNDGDEINIHCLADEHTTATDSDLALQEAILQDLQNGSIDSHTNSFLPPIFPNLKVSFTLKYSDSQHSEMVRASDVIANRVLYEISNESIANIKDDNFHFFFYPRDAR